MDAFKEFPTTPISPAHDALALTPSDSATLAQTSRALYVGGTGAVAVRMAGGAQVTLTAVPAGSILPLRVDMVLATGTTATGVVALW